MEMFPTFSYVHPAASKSGALATIENSEVETCYALDDTQSGKVALQVPQGIAGGANKSVQRTRTAGTRAFLGFVMYNPGKPAAADNFDGAPEYTEGDLVPVIRKGRAWIYCENWGTLDPMLADLTLFFARNADGPGLTNGGNLRYGDNDTATCTALTAGKILKVHDARILAGSAALIHVEFAF